MDDTARCIARDPYESRQPYALRPILSDPTKVRQPNSPIWSPIKAVPRGPTSGIKLIAIPMLFLLLGPLGGCASMAIDGADRAQLADVASTGAGISAGLVEANPVMAPLVSAGPPGLAAVAGIKLGLNRLGRRQEPAVCRQWLCLSTAAGWGAATSNMAMLVAPPMALAAIPVAVGTYRSAWVGSALETCYEGMLSDAILRVPVGTGTRQMPGPQRRELMAVAGFWPDADMMPNTRAVDGRMLVHLLLIDDLGSLEHFISRHELDWSILGVQDRDGNDILALDLGTVAPHLLREPGGESVQDPGSSEQLVSVTDITDGAVTIPKYRDLTWQIAAVGPRPSEEPPGELQQALADVPDFGVAPERLRADLSMALPEAALPD